MRNELQKALIEADETIGNGVAKPYDGYSGRGMYGKETAGVVVNDLSDLLVLVAQAAVDLPGDFGPEDFVEEVSRLRTDSLGRQMIVY